MNMDKREIHVSRSTHENLLVGLSTSLAMISRQECHHHSLISVFLNPN
jgi:hypothetical protein